MPSELELVADKELIDELLHRFDDAVFIAVKPPARGNLGPDSVTICKWGSPELMAFHCRAFATAMEHQAGCNIQKQLNTEED